VLTDGAYDDGAGQRFRVRADASCPAGAGSVAATKLLIHNIRPILPNCTEQYRVSNVSLGGIRSAPWQPQNENDKNAGQCLQQFAGICVLIGNMKRDNTCPSN
jgi:hypothetical protein